MPEVTHGYDLSDGAADVSKRFADMAKPPPRNAVSGQFLPSRGAVFVISGCSFCYVSVRSPPKQGFFFR